MATSTRFQLSGLDKMRTAIQDKAASIVKQAKQGLRLEAEFVRTDSMEKVPVDEGALRSSAHLIPETGAEERVEAGGTVSSVTIAYGGPSAPYAAAIHEYPDKHQPPSWAAGNVQFGPGDRGPKYLSRAMDEAEPGMLDRIADGIDVD